MPDVYKALPVGYALHEYRIESTLGVGGFGLTYLAHDCNLDTKVAIKEYLPGDFAIRNDDHSVEAKSGSTQQSFEWGLKRFIDESRLLASFRHPSIVRVMRFFEANKTAYMVMEFIAGKQLNDWVKDQSALDQASLLRIVLPLLDGLEVIHSQGYLHRDIKPPNIFIRTDGNPILIDFGSARMKAGPDQNLTAIVTPGFAPLEQYHSHGKQGPWTDLYSFAGVLYWVVTGKKPVEAAARVREDIMPSALTTADRARYGDAFLSNIDWALKPNEDDRPQSVAAWREALTGKVPADNVPIMALQGASTPAAPVDAVSVSRPSGVTFDRDLLKRMEGELATHLGPIAAVMVRTAAKKAATVQELVTVLAAELPDDQARTAFLRKINNDSSIPLSQPPQRSEAVSISTVTSEKISTTTLSRLSEETLRRAEAELAQHIGAVAKVVVRRAAKKARDESELYLLMADEIEDKVEKKNFIRKALSVSHKN